ncbi:MAG TPA: PAS domain S-box protein, partial [Candidatus Binatia bacterium]|nr:PAS domain S-box protein [Candidatus Binatia bacterium]
MNFNTVAVLTIDHYGKIASADGACVKMFGWEATELVGKHLESLLKETSRGDLQTFVEQVQSDFSNQLASVQVTALRKSGAEFPASITRLAWSSETSVMTKSATAEAVWTAVFRDLSSLNSAPVLVPPSVTLPASPLAEAPAAPPMQFSAARDLRGGEGTQTSLRHASEELRKRIEAASAEAARHREALEKAQQERDGLSTRIDAQETELNRARDAAGRESETRKLLEQQLQNLQTAKAELEKQISEQKRSKEDLEKASEQFRAQLDEAKSAADRAQAAHDQEIARVRSLEENLARLRTEYEDAASNLTAEQRAAAESTRQVEELETRLHESTVEAERLKDELERATAERNRLEAEWQTQLSTAKAAAAKAEAAWLEEAGRNRNFEERLRVLGNSLQMEQAQRAQAVFGQELADLREVRDELNTKLEAEQQASAEIRRRAEDLEASLRRSSAEVEHIKADKEKQAAERQRLEAEWHKQLSTAETLTKKLEATCQEMTDRNKRYEEEVARLRQSQDELENKLTTERQKAADSKKRIDELKHLLRQNEAELERAKAELANADRNKQHETELTGLYQVRDELTGKLATEQKATQDSKERTDELENRLRANNANLERIKADRESHARRQAALRSQLESKLSAAKAAGERAEKMVKEKTALCTRLEKEFAKVQQSRDELNGKLSAERQAVAESRRKCEEVEGRLRESTAELENIKAEREKEAVAQASLESR